ncbi:methyltransferase [Streptomyces xanthophaeus]|uniref:methyltransferase n=1 Tax=Streptomyces xanthophaeus TaxID=67385 RepID=UPI003F4CD3AC
MTPDATLARIREYMVGPTRFMTLVSCFELGIIDRLRDNSGLTAAELSETAGAKPDAVEQLLLLLVKEGFVAYDEATGGYSLDALAGVPASDLEHVLAGLQMIKGAALRQLYYLTESVRSGSLVGLKELYGFDGNLYDAMAVHTELREPWAKLMNSETTRIDPWFFENIDIAAGAQVLDLAGNTGLGAIHTYKLKASPGLRVTTFDLPEKEQESLANFRAHGVEEHCAFIGGDVFAEVPKGFDTVLIKHFLPMFDKSDVFRILRAVNESLEIGGELNILTPVYPEDTKDADFRSIDFFPAFFLGCAMGQGGPQKMSTYQSWLEECGFKVTKAIAEEAASMPPEALPVDAILCATKVA